MPTPRDRDLELAPTGRPDDLRHYRALLDVLDRVAAYELPQRVPLELWRELMSTHADEPDADDRDSDRDEHPPRVAGTIVIPREVQQMDGCTCGGWDYHAADCPALDWDEDTLAARRVAAQIRVDGWIRRVRQGAG